MGTRGLTGFVVDGKVKASYQQHDSYPTGVGFRVVEFLENTKMSLDEMRDAVRALKVVSEADQPTADEAKYLGSFHDGSVSTGADWYSNLRNCQGYPGLILESGFILDSVFFAQNSLFCEWAYLINLDECVIEVYKGFNEYDAVGRFGPGEADESGYYPVTLLTQIPFAEPEGRTIHNFSSEIAMATLEGIQIGARG